MCLGLTACGGNGSDGGAPANSGSVNLVNNNGLAEGAWHSEQSNGDVLDLVLLENGSLYALSSSPVSTATSVPLLAFDQGPFIAIADQLTAQVTHYNDAQTTVSGAVTGTVLQGTSISGSAATGTSSTHSYAVRPTTAFDASYHYQTAASVATISGPWPSGYALESSTPVTFSIDAAGVLSGTSGGCPFSGSVQPRVSGKNVFDVTVVFGLTPCASPGKTFSGIAISYIASNRKRQFTAALQDATKAFGTMLYAQR
jgi:hypothetical protein